MRPAVKYRERASSENVEIGVCKDACFRSKAKRGLLKREANILWVIHVGFKADFHAFFGHVQDTTRRSLLETT